MSAAILSLSIQSVDIGGFLRSHGLWARKFLISDISSKRSSEPRPIRSLHCNRNIRSEGLSRGQSDIHTAIAVISARNELRLATTALTANAQSFLSRYCRLWSLLSLLFVLKLTEIGRYTSRISLDLRAGPSRSSLVAKKIG